MNIYFACSITGGRKDEDIYKLIVRAMQADGHEVPTAHLAERRAVGYETAHTPEEVYTRDVSWIDECDVLIAEVSTPSHGVGYEVGYALQNGKPVLCLHRQDVHVSKMLTGNTHANIRVRAYATPQQAVEIMRAYLADF